MASNKWIFFYIFVNYMEKDRLELIFIRVKPLVSVVIFKTTLKFWMSELIQKSSGVWKKGKARQCSSRFLISIFEEVMWIISLAFKLNQEWGWIRNFRRNFLHIRHTGQFFSAKNTIFLPIWPTVVLESLFERIICTWIPNKYYFS